MLAEDELREAVLLIFANKQVPFSVSGLPGHCLLAYPGIAILLEEQNFATCIMIYKATRDLPGVALVIFFHDTFHSSQKNLISYRSCHFTNFNVSFGKYSIFVNIGFLL